jgi:hypothetical protein
MKKVIVGMIAASVLAVCAAPVNAAVAGRAIAIRAIQHAKSGIVKACDGIGNTVWRNKGAVLVGGTAVGVATKPEVFVGGATAIASTSIGTTVLFYLLAAMLVIVGVRYLLYRFRLWKVLPLMLSGHQGLAGQIPGLNFDTAVPPSFAHTPQYSPPRTGSSHAQQSGTSVRADASNR